MSFVLTGLRSENEGRPSTVRRQAAPLLSAGGSSWMRGETVTQSKAASETEPNSNGSAQCGRTVTVCERLRTQ